MIRGMFYGESVLLPGDAHCEGSDSDDMDVKSLNKPHRSDPKWKGVVPGYLKVLVLVGFAGHLIGLYYLTQNRDSMADGAATVYATVSKYGIRSGNRLVVFSNATTLASDTACDVHDVGSLPPARIGGGLAYSRGDYLENNGISVDSNAVSVELRGTYDVQTIDNLTYNLIFAFEAITLLFAGVRAYVIYTKQWYRDDIADDNVFPYYYVEYAITGGLVAVALASLHGVRDANILMGIYVALLTCNVLGLAADREFTEDNYSLSAAAFFHAAAWVPLIWFFNLLYGLFQSYNDICTRYSYKLPDFVQTILYAEFFLFALFGIVSLLLNIHRVRMRDSEAKLKRGVMSSVAFEVLSIVSKLTFVFVVGGATDAI